MKGLIKRKDATITERGLNHQQKRHSGLTGLIVALTGEFAGEEFPINAGGIMMGRDPIACQIVFHKNTQGVSRYHCIVSFNPQTDLYIINDLGSTYGTYSEETGAIQKDIPAVLAQGDRFYLGSRVNSFEVR